MRARTCSTMSPNGRERASERSRAEEAERRGRAVVGEDLGRELAAAMRGEDLAQDQPIIGGDREIDALLEARRIEAGPAAEDAAAIHPAAQHRHEPGPAMVGAVALVRAKAPAELAG